MGQIGEGGGVIAGHEFVAPNGDFAAENAQDQKIDGSVTEDFTRLQADIGEGTVDPASLPPGLQDALGPDTNVQAATGFQSQG